MSIRSRPATTTPTVPATPIRLHIDWTACDGRGLCVEILSALLERDEWGYPIALGYSSQSDRGSNIAVPNHLLAAAGEAVALCPRLALSLHVATHPATAPATPRAAAWAPERGETRLLG
ncbi:ferredoxin [Cryobacterium sp. PH29-G1]|uniref:ferredoxin n=1 Tax=Cryobacterium sp. PH29-G1 TaxID=3046211 RepID=UPI0024BA0FA1|nr:ferredoxin [Cryobacterium sp. PH29-G1]MDJ0349363.1 ferredoxin [Cryobacterium sp. PH29-G1]